MSEVIDIEALRDWVRTHENRTALARETEIPYQTLNNFVRGTEPRFGVIQILLLQRQRESAPGKRVAV